VFVVWSSQLGGSAGDVPEAARLMPDARAEHYWDGERRVGAVFQSLELGEQVLRGSEPVWDVWLLFGPEARWPRGGSAPRPAWWEHQLRSMPAERRLDPERFARKAGDLVSPGSVEPRASSSPP
jgi:hypothetical protein